MRFTKSAVRLTALFLSGILLLGSQSGCGDSNKEASSKKALAVHVINAKATDELLWIETLGQVEGAKEVEIRAQVSGTLEKITYKEGEEVKEGQTLFILDDAPYEAALRTAKAGAAEARATLEKAELDAKRYEGLYKANAASKKQRDDAISARKIARAQLSQALAKVSDAQVDMDRTRVKATSDGVASRSEVNLGALVSATTTRLATLTQPDKLRVKFQLSERDFAGRTVGLTNTVRLYDATRKEIAATLDYVSRQIDVATSTRALRATIAAGSGLVPGQLVSVQLAIDTLKGVFRIPQRGVQQLPDGSYQVFTAVDGKVHPVTVKVGPWKDTDWIILSGLKEGDAVIVDQLQRLREGTAISVEEPSVSKTP